MARTPDGALTTASTRPGPPGRVHSVWGAWLVAALGYAGALVLAHATRHAEHTAGPIPAMWFPGALIFVWLCTALTWSEGRRRYAVILTATASVGVYAAVGAALGERGSGLALHGVANAVGGLVFALGYRWLVRTRSLAPGSGADLTALLASGVLGAAAALLIGPYPGVGVMTEPHRVLLWWVLEATAYGFFTGACLLTLWLRRPRDEAIPTRPGQAYLQLVVVGLALWGVAAWPQIPLGWTLLVPAVWAGMTLGPWVAAAYSLTVALAMSVIGTSPHALLRGSSSWLPQSVLLDLLITAFVFVAMLLALLRDQRARLLSAVDEHSRNADNQAGLLQVVFESMSEGLLLLDSERRLVLHNEGAQRIMGRALVRADPVEWTRTLQPIGAAGHVPAHADFGRVYDGDRWTMQFLAPPTSSGEGVRKLQIDATPVSHDGGTMTALIVRDVTTEQQRIEELANFAGIAAHDLKSPLTAIQGWLEMADDALGSDPPMARLALNRGMAASNRMSREIDDWLSFNVAREGALRSEKLILREIVEELTYPTARVTIDAPHHVFADRTLTRQLLINLIGNAVKYVRPGEEPSISVTTDLDADGWVVTTVADRGIGIPEGERERVFEPFRRASTVTAGYQGSGLGLALCRRIVDRHGGDISAHRNSAGGTSIRFTLPAG